MNESLYEPAIRPRCPCCRGRPPLHPGEPTQPFTVRLPSSLRVKLLKLGGAAWVRRMLESVSDDLCNR